MKNSHHGGTETRRKSGNWIKNAWYIWWAALREIFDESAYDRFLLRKESSRSVASYRDFMQERAAAISKKPRCC